MERSDRPHNDAVERAWDALENDEPEKALQIVKKAPADEPSRYVLTTAALLALDDVESARQAMDQADALDLPFDDPDGLWTRGDLLLREWRIAEAEAVYETLAKDVAGADVFDRLAFCAELRHDRARADQFYAAAQDLSPDEFEPPPRLDDHAFMKEIDIAVAELPEQFQQVLDGCRIEVLPVPTLEIARAGDLTEVAPDTLGLFSGPSLLDGQGDAPELPPVIYLFQRNLERASGDEDELVEEIRITLYHELGHLLGFDEEGVDRMGLA